MLTPSQKLIAKSVEHKFRTVFRQEPNFDLPLDAQSPFAVQIAKDTGVSPERVSEIWALHCEEEQGVPQNAA